MGIKNGPTIAECDKCGKREEFKVSYHTPGWVEISVDKDGEGEKKYDYDDYIFCSWGCARDYCDDKHAKLEF